MDDYDFDADMGYSETTPRTLYVGSLDPSITEDLLLMLFGKIAECKGCKIIQEPGNDPYAFLEFVEHQGASAALAAMNKRKCCGKEMKVNWATSPGAQAKQDTSKHYHIFVGDLSPDIETHQLREAFAPFGSISDCKIIRDPQTLKSKGYGFVSFVEKKDAECAIGGMNGQWIGCRAIRTNWATRKPPAPPAKEANYHPLNYEEVFSKSSPTNCTVYCGGILAGLTDETIRKAFETLGKIEEVRVFKEKGYAFIRFNSKEAAANAIVKMHGADICGHTVKCSWGKETSDGSTPAGGSQMSASSQPMGQGAYPYYNQMGYWGYPQGYSQVQQGYMQPYMQQGYGYGSGYSGVQAMQWQGVHMQQGGSQPQQPQQQYNGQGGQGGMGGGYSMPQGQ